MGAKVARACDACRVRKVKCSGSQPCAQCSHLRLACAFAPLPAKRKPGVRGRLVAQLRSQAAGGEAAGVSSPSSSLSSLSPQGSDWAAGAAAPLSTAAATTGSAAAAAAATIGSAATPTIGSAAAATTTATTTTASPLAITSIAAIVDSHASSSSPSSSSPKHGATAPASSAAFPPAFFLRLLPEYEQRVYPVNPVLTLAEMSAAIDNMDADLEDAALAHAFGAVTINLTRPSWTLYGDIAAQMTSLIEHSLWAHRRAELGLEQAGEPGSSSRLQSDMPVSVKRIMTCIFNEITLMAFKRFDRSFALLREAIAMIQMLKMHQYSASQVAALGVQEVSRRQRMYWEAYIHERFLCIMAGFPCTMIPLGTGLPVADFSVPRCVVLGFNRLIHLFRIMDGPLLAHWTSEQAPHADHPVTASWIESKQTELDQDEADAASADASLAKSGHASLSELQHVDLFVTRLWLRTLVWQLALSHRLLRSTPALNAHDGLSLHFPVQRLSCQLRALVSRLESVASVVIHGSGLLQKLFEITSTVADVLALPPGPQRQAEFTRAHIDDFLFLVRFLFSFERTAKHQRDYLREKLESLRLIYTAADFGKLAEPSPPEV
ncbi:hypothetical protein CDD81_4773 [Ophiocordyceps australis]|uniref:Zn(2)-C6 fungal-type domain-containing protein n=1 Tax=Ophiocordyceps australis TaxID=1399860 RepID=A0A2C5XAB5_9HYPO|nr:hypothetical protein CDD81_4773 [Ophiocordyceps australis]